MTTLAAIRQATPRDAFAVAALHLQCGRERGAGIDAGFLDRWTDAWLADLANRPFWLAEIENRPLGVAGLQVVTDLPRVGEATSRRRALGGFLYVTPTFRRCGIGAQLTREVAAWAAAHDVASIVVDLRPLGAAGRGIGRRLGITAGDGVVEARVRRPVVLG